jgi:putative thioredoxin
VLPSENRARIEAAERALDAGEDTEAESLANLVLAAEPANAEAKLVLARALLFRNAERAGELAREASAAKPALYQLAQSVDVIAGLIRDADEAADLPQGAGRDEYAAALRALSTRDLDGAAAGLIESLRRDRRYNDDAARKAAVALFNLLGDAHPVTQRHRRAFQMAVF